MKFLVETFQETSLLISEKYGKIPEKNRVLFLQRLGGHHDWLDKALPDYAVPANRPPMPIPAHLL